MNLEMEDIADFKVETVLFTLRSWEKLLQTKQTNSFLFQISHLRFNITISLCCETGAVFQVVRYSILHNGEIA